MKLKSYYPATLDVDGDTIKIGVKRLTFQEGAELRGRLRQLEAQQAADERAADDLSEELLGDVVARYIRVESDVVLETDEGDVPIKTGEQLLDAYGGRKDVILRLYVLVLRQNTLTSKEKKASRSPTDSSPSSAGPDLARAGRRLGTTAGSAGRSSSAGREDATSRAQLPSGSTRGQELPSTPSDAPSSS